MEGTCGLAFAVVQRPEQQLGHRREQEPRTVSPLLSRFRPRSQTGALGAGSGPGALDFTGSANTEPSALCSPARGSTLSMTLQNTGVLPVTCSGPTRAGKPWLSAGGPCPRLPFSHPASPRLLSESVVSLGLPAHGGEADLITVSSPCWVQVHSLPATVTRAGSPFLQIHHDGLSAKGTG